jgi:integrase
VKISLTNLTVQSLKPGTYYDIQLPAFGIRVGKHRRTWLITKGRQRVKITLGHYPEVPLQEARRRAKLALGTPLALKDALTYPEALERFLEQDRWRSGSKRVLKSSLKHFAWKRPLSKITFEDVATALDAIKAPSARAHALKDIRTFFNWCVPRYLDRSPAEGFKMPSYVPRQRVLSDEELARVWQATTDLGRYGTQLQVLILTGQRVNQIVAYDPSWLDADLLTFPANVMKGNRDHTIPVGPMTLTRLPELTTRSMQGKKKAELDRRAGVTDWVLHDLRRVLASQWASLGVQLPTIEAYLGHRSGSFAGIVGVYQRHTWLPEMRKAVQLWETKVRSLVRPV